MDYLRADAEILPATWLGVCISALVAVGLILVSFAIHAGHLCEGPTPELWQ